MRHRLRAFALHLLASGIVLSLILGTLYAGWYRWPGWYLAGAATVTLTLAAVDLVAGPLLTFVIAAPAKPRRVLARDVAVIAAVQVVALLYGCVALWNGRPLYYAFSVDELQLVQAYDLDPDELAQARRRNSPLMPHWYSLPRWIWAPLPDDALEQARIVTSAVSGGSDVVGMPRYYRTWDSGLPQLRGELRTIDDLKYFSLNEKKALKAKVRAAGLDPMQADAMAFSGRGRPLLAVFDPATATLKKLVRVD